MSKIEDSLWRCTVHNSSDTGECDTVVIQQDMEEHLRVTHKRSLLSPGDVIPHFVLVRTAEVRRGGERRGSVADDTMSMFEKGIDFR